MTAPITPDAVVRFWREAGPKAWFAKSDAFDTAIRGHFEAAHHAAARGEHDAWIETAEGALGLLLLLDQFPRNLYRGSAHAFATDGKARTIARDALARGHDLALEPELRSFFLLPFEHSEALADQDEAVRLATVLRDRDGDEGTLKWALIHRDIIARFGRFPHRNPAFGRTTTPEEQVFLESGGFSG